MSTPQSAILPDAEPFALYSILKIKHNHAQVLAQLQTLPAFVEDINNTQAGAELTLSLAFTKAFWQRVNAPMPEELIDFPILGEGEIQAPSTDVDVLIHCHSKRHDLLFYVMRKCLSEIAESVDVVDETYGFRYLDARDMTGFIDGTENPKEEQRREVAIVPEGEFAGGSYVMVQRFVHNLPAWNRLNMAAQEKVIGRTKPDSVELDKVPAASHVGRVDIKEEGKGLKIVRHSLPYGSASGEHGLLFIAYCQTLHNFKVMLESMYGVTDGKTDQLLRFTRAVTGAYFFAPSQEMLAALTIQ
ncbi:Dyp-type peroxidase [Vibrio cincinnatiensis]|uniref:Putative iron-dependent peroxidase n=1 Tax=Vibrio cincinnatiensis DSM 19608 TaxID=1123491 RepID=A0A1T4MGV5_VIBCI|nr:Dyp-type peroxidase [Vibrio cincinnatiensis]MCG3746282.1 Dyp-type peroxidase [Vibrio cincinnatiensis]MCG3760949.1 Dyp-type peroxidase [Vibrio cincinnatiensis]MCG3764274.1 Dyp-type peroxidase [Vibrio cincinnatiensis]SJZ66107.1 putative iron-dependent peroxidase [Vibrio cincinnatiensis DSM 19608]SUP47980.1 tyrA protein [Vibrio cincinnatiensis]